MPADVEHVVHTPCEPVVAISVTSAAVTSHVIAVEARKVDLFHAGMVAHDCAQCRRPRAPDREKAFGLAFELTARLIQHHGGYPKERQRRGARLELHVGERQRRNHVPTRLGLPPRVYNRAPTCANRVEVPAPCIRVNRLADGPQHAQRRAVVRCDESVALTLEGTNCRRCRVELRHAVPRRDLPQSPSIGPAWHTLKDHLLRGIQQWAIRHVGMACDPTAVGRAEVYVAGMIIKGILECSGHVDHVPTCGVHHSFRRAGRAGRIQHE
mmetsp:Transcript_5953/g.15824  ORF Transcript_5953/g.15824 Transcript_5953/m.15824 type:complete len:268 (-) Transcript_5953:1117-1920(-)